MATVEEALGIALDLHQGGRLNEAETLYRRILDAVPDQGDARHLLGVLRAQRGDAGQAVALLCRAVALRPGADAFHGNLGKAHLLAGDAARALSAFARAAHLAPDNAEHAASRDGALGRLGPGARLALDPADAVLWNERGIAVHREGRYAAAEAAFRRTLALDPEFAAAANNLAGTLYPSGRREEAVAMYRHALALQPDDCNAATNLGNVLKRLNRLGEALAWCERAWRVNPDAANTNGNLGRVLQALARPGEAVERLRRAVALNPGDSSTHSDLIFTLDLDPEVGVVEQQAERRRWAARHAAGLAPADPAFANPRDPERRLRVGYVSADFRFHSAAFAFGPVLTSHDPARVELVCYSNNPVEDAMTARLRAAAALWRPVYGLSDEELAAQIRADGIDVLVDLSGHSLGNRLLTFARRPAPVQATAWGHVTGTGLSTMDALLADPVSVPECDRPLFPETIVDLPCVLFCDSPADAPDVVPLPPAAAGRGVTFGCLNRLNKMSDPALALWCRILRAVPGARLLIKAPGAEEPTVRDRLTAAVAAHGVESERLVLIGRSSRVEHLATYGLVDIALDPFPQSGGVSTVEALWMGVPVLTLLGRTLPGRIAAAVLDAAGLPDWIVKDEEAYLRRAVAAAADVERLTRLRASLRADIVARPLGDARVYTRAVEDAYRHLWRRWCAADVAR
ncbi:MAG TPA: tetratricopeptide repeat protein [Azospirillum sp.]|nr:tetratricopeptide repeat protein [Azospirillum sp.]